jgi:hypothetical protein
VVESKIGEDMAMLKAKLAGKLVKREAQWASFPIIYLFWIRNSNKS